MTAPKNARNFYGSNSTINPNNALSTKRETLPEFELTKSLSSIYRDKVAKRLLNPAITEPSVVPVNAPNLEDNKPKLSDSDVVGVGGVRSSNTYTEKLNSRFQVSAKSVDYEPLSNVVFCDYLKASVKDIDCRNDTISELTANGGMFQALGITVHDRNKGAQGYDHSIELRMIDPDDSDDVFNAGFFYFSDAGKMKGGYLELKGRPCQLLQGQFTKQWNELLDKLEYNGWVLSSVDLALDIYGDYALRKGITVPKLDIQAGQGLFNSDKSKNGNVPMSPARIPQGDWSDINDNKTTRETYDPRQHCLDGLTIYIGAKRSPDKWKCYEKAKEVLSKAKGSPDGSDELAWVRIEHTMKKVTNKLIPWDALRQPDKHFSRDRSQLRDIMQDIRQERLQLGKCESIVSETIKRTKNVKIRHSLFWANRQAGGAVKKMQSDNWTDSEIVKALTSNLSKTHELENIANRSMPVQLQGAGNATAVR